MIGEALRIPQVPRDYQEAAIAATIADCLAGEKPLIAAATGAGKTTIIAEILRQVIDPYLQRGLVIAHTNEIVLQLYERILNQFSGALDHYYGFMKPGIGIVMGVNDVPMARIVIATWQSLREKRLNEVLQHGPFDWLVVDEAHHAYGAAGNSYAKIIRGCEAANPNLKRFGVTATPERTSGEALESLWTKIGYEWSIETGINTGYLAPVTRLKVQTKVDLSKVKSHMGDYAHGKLASILGAENWTELCIKAYEQFIAPEGRLTLAFMPSVEMSKAFSAALNDAGYSAAHVDGETPKAERANLLRLYAAGKIRVLSNFSVFSEGLDLPETSAILLARPTRSRSLLTQMIGRGLRKFPGKTDCLLVDMTIRDVKVLTAGTLVGKMKVCPKCDADIWAFLNICSHCGYEYPAPKPLVDDYGTPFENESEAWIGKDLVAEITTLFDNAVAAWYKSPNGTMSCSLAWGQGVMFVTPPDRDDLYRLYRVPEHGQVAFVARNQDVVSLIRTADEAARVMGKTAIKDAMTWRDGAATSSQIGALSKLGFTSATPLTKGQASELIAHIKAEAKLRAVAESARRSPAAPVAP